MIEPQACTCSSHWHFFLLLIDSLSFAEILHKNALVVNRVGFISIICYCLGRLWITSDSSYHSFPLLLRSARFGRDSWDFQGRQTESCHFCANLNGQLLKTGFVGQCCFRGSHSEPEMFSINRWKSTITKWEDFSAITRLNELSLSQLGAKSTRRGRPDQSYSHFFQVDRENSLGTCGKASLFDFFAISENIDFTPVRLSVASRRCEGDYTEKLVF